MTSNKQAPDFQTLVLQHKGDRSYETIAKLAGGLPKAKALQAIVQKGFTRMPNPETFEGLSRALNVRKRDLVLAAARTLGIDVGDDDQGDLILVGAKRLPLASQDLLVAMSREMQAWMDGRHAEAAPEDSADAPATIDPDDAANYDLAAHPPFETDRDRFNKEHGSTGEENQDPEDTK
ncbi:hypothetical protein DQ353_00425 [Arthrobacter sp. AQ5-05]|uniref:hypothetical protein n=1 Tax=Arthrobacter sp. AQ5-05 TaxID=2184581 RepID=UPI000DCB51A5|nr:hypothetical protein [Arthrobacter sp. AQ5-05]RAX50901.1 hypothetical protein DQ353_00425 [Arthrobacter sp. AQ5-05]